MTVIQGLIEHINLPRMAPVRQIFEDTSLPDVDAALRESFRTSGVAERIKPGARIAVGVGSRGLADLPLLVRVTVDELKKLGAEPFIVPAMGSHGGATALGQERLLAGLGVTEESVGAPIRSSMETVELDRLPNGLPVLIDRYAMEADGICVINRVKAHTSFTAPIESGMAKMITIGLGKQKGADSCHAHGFGKMAEHVVEMAKIKLAKAPILFGVASVENAYDKIAIAEVVLAENILERELDLLKISKASMPRILFNPIDVLVVDKMGKEYSGTGTDPNITGRAPTPYIKLQQEATRFVIRDLSMKSGGNATGMGLADIITRRLFDKIDFNATYANHITSTVMLGAKIPMIMDNDELALKCAIKTCNSLDPGNIKMVRLENTLHLETIWISEALLADAEANPAVEILGEARAIDFDADGNIADTMAAAA
ncbi:nickel-dependent lactate racemase [Acuticoccus sp. M5D2P5]|uniref:lactate racemase domain-containing protein n=1 Tax=Acuticoccus kalidii TaxID=2910977 RepID=UPI001F384E3E|nr:lactate racemase domain-containing protein [Acuticoccus kalidii]MCF3933887.1 nickel-dependent lactate racemase [Acuticoccus kalidii]